MNPAPLMNAGSTSAPTSKARGFWPYGWWRFVDFRIGIIPLPIYIILVAMIVSGVLAPEKPEIPTMIALLAVGGFTCGEIGKRLPVLHLMGAAAIFATFVPSYLVYAHLLPATMIDSVTNFTKSSQFLYLFIASIAVGSIFGMDRTMLVRGFLKIFVPLFAGSIVAGTVGTLVGVALGQGAYHTFFFVVVPIMAGGVGEGALPLSWGYSEILHQPQDNFFAMVLPPVMLGSLMAILLSGGLNFVGKRYPHLTGEGRLQPQEHDELADADSAPAEPVDVGTVAAAGVTAIAFYLVGIVAQKLITWPVLWPAPVVMLVLAVLVKSSRAVSPSLQQGASIVYRFFATAVTYPLLFAIGVAMTPWDKLVAAFTIPNLITIFATVASLMGTGYALARWLRMYPIDVAIVNACHSGQGGTGDVAILTAANRMQLMPFAQVATRIGGVTTVILATSLLRFLT